MSDIIGVQAVFPSDTAMQDAIARLTLLGFDRADLSVPQRGSDDAAAENPTALPTTEVDTRQARTLATSMAGSVGAIAAAGVTIATGGAAALAAGAALAVGAGAAGLASAGGTAAGEAGSDIRAEAAERGDLLLMARTRTAEKIDMAIAAMRDAGGHDVARVANTAGVDSAAWTG